MQGKQLIYIAIAAIIVVVLGVLLFFGQEDEAQPGDAVSQEPSSVAGDAGRPSFPAQPITRERPVTRELPDVIPSTTDADIDKAFEESFDEPDALGGITYEEANSLIREEGSRLTSDRKVESWLLLSDLPSKIIVLVDNVSKGKIPYSDFRELAPDKSFQEVIGTGSLQIDSAIHDRYMPLVDVATSVDTDALVEFLEAVEPILESEYEQLGLTGRGGFRGELRRAIDRILSIEVNQGEIDLVRESLVLKFADQQMEENDDLTKFMHRLGPQNTAALQSKLREIRRYL